MRVRVLGLCEGCPYSNPEGSTQVGLPRITQRGILYIFSAGVSSPTVAGARARESSRALMASSGGWRASLRNVFASSLFCTTVSGSTRNNPFRLCTLDTAVCLSPCAKNPLGGIHRATLCAVMHAATTIGHRVTVQAPVAAGPRQAGTHTLSS